MKLDCEMKVSRLANKVDAPVASSRVLLLGNDDRVVLAVARGLGREGIEVHVGWCDPTSPALRSNYVARYHEIPAYRAGETQWLVALNELTRNEAFDLVIPCNDFAVIPLQQAREQLAKNVKWYLINEEAFEVAFDKAETSRVARSLGINTPKEHDLSCRQLQRLAEQTAVSKIDGQDLRFPVYIKPRSSITANDIKQKRSAEKIEGPDALSARLREGCPGDGLLIQESFCGDGVGVEVLASEGNVLMQLQHRRLRETIDGGSTYRETIAAIAELTEATSKLVQRLNYTGVAMFEFRHNRKTGRWVLLEINARFWGSLPLAVAAGANFPAGLYQLLVLGRTDFDSNYQVGKRCRNLIKDLRAHRKQANSELQLSRLLFGKEHLDFFAIDDWRPQLTNLQRLLTSLFGKLIVKTGGLH